jgi:hypothetical protein
MLLRSAFRSYPPVLSIAVLLVACTPSPSPHPSSPPPIAPPPVSPRPPIDAGNWRDVPLAPGTWHYVDGREVSAARYGPDGAAPLIVVRCDKARRQIAIMLAGSAQQLTIATSSGSEHFAAGRVDEGGFAMTAALFAASDPLLDRLAFSRGRFALAGPARAFVAAPTWAEPARTIEDCRK